jgi:hypothetical protein
MKLTLDPSQFNLFQSIMLVAMVIAIALLIVMFATMAFRAIARSVKKMSLRKPIKAVNKFKPVVDDLAEAKDGSGSLLILAIVIIVVCIITHGK